MKKTKSLRVAAGMFALTLITSCFVGGTFAKYTTAGTAKDSARVAKFGVSVNATGSLFKTEYNTDDPDHKDAIQISVQSANQTDKVVAPGTTNTDKLTVGLTGTPEVAVEIKFAVDTEAEGFKDIFLKQGTYKNYTGIGDETFELGADYHPLVFTLNKNGVAVPEAQNLPLKDFAAALDDISIALPPNTDLSTLTGENEYSITWKWEFQNTIAGDTSKQIVDAADTLLGNLIAGTATDANVPEASYSTDIAFDLAITVTQID